MYTARLSHARAGGCFVSLEHPDPNSKTSLPSLDEIVGTWHIIRTSVPFWKDKRNPTVTFQKHSDSTSTTSYLENSTNYQPSTSTKIKTVNGTDSPVTEQQGTYEWRGAGWLKVASSSWEILGYEKSGVNAWLFVYTPGSIFTTGGLILYSNSKEGLSEGALERLEAVFAGWKHPKLQELVVSMYDTRRD
ncbi:hypothetical protein HYALB_00001608 [Hymenoscyphus albidus]|uniref:Uncharacterized protein n=1 Tax=Hymenoscyphus albidus TaxID=595503 RepID=A0A9N9L963_9HELO|nr:hypothetical protein HYALB_00001608 [Hymenoscyphus albidus]